MGLAVGSCLGKLWASRASGAWAEATEDQARLSGPELVYFSPAHLLALDGGDTEARGAVSPGGTGYLPMGSSRPCAGTVAPGSRDGDLLPGWGATLRITACHVKPPTLDPMPECGTEGAADLSIPNRVRLSGPWGAF